MSRIRQMTDKQVPSYPLRMPASLREELTIVAKQNNRSVNAEIIARLESSLAAKRVGARGLQDPAAQAMWAQSLADVAVLALTQDESWRSDVARRVAEMLQAPKPRARGKKA